MRTLITGETWGHVYILCLSEVIGNRANARAMAGHYCGWALDLEERLDCHERGQGAALTRWCVRYGVTWQAHAWPAPLWSEKWLKSKKCTPRFCPSCCAKHGWKRREILTARQLDLGLDELDDFPTIPPGLDKGDWLEWSISRSWRQPLSVRVVNDEGALIPW